MVARVTAIIISAGKQEWQEFTVPAYHSLGLSTRIDYELLTVDNGGQNRGMLNIKEMVPYAEAVNLAAAEVHTEKMLILNNDITATGDWMQCIEQYATPYCGAVSLIKEGVAYIEGWCICIDTDLWHTIGGFNAEYKNSWEDVDLAWRLSRLGVTPCVIPMPFKHIWGATRARYAGSNKWDSENRTRLLSRMREAKSWKWQRLG